jgi:hypothetical protein
MKFRIVEIIHHVDELKNDKGRSEVEYIIQKKNFWGEWIEIVQKEVESKRISHKTYSDAESYLMSEYMGHGMCEHIGNEYEYTPYTYYV